MKTELQAMIHNTTREAFALVLADKSAGVSGCGGIVSEGHDVFREGHAKYRVHVGIVGEHKDRLQVLVYADFPLADGERHEINGAIQRATKREKREEMETERQKLLDKLAAVDAKIKELETPPNE